MGPCCVEGCTGISEDIVYFEFPTSRGLRRKWLEMIRIPSKIPLGTVVCSQHFNKNDYETVRGKARLKKKVVPTLKLYNTLPKQSSSIAETTSIEDKVLPNEKTVENTEIVAQTDTTADKTDATAGNTDTTAGNTDTTPGNTDKTAGNTDTTAGNTDTTAGNTDTTAGNTDTTPGNTGKTAGNTDTTAGNTDKTAGNTDTTAGNTDTTAGNTDTTAGNTDTTAGDTDTTDDSTDIIAENIETTADNTDKNDKKEEEKESRGEKSEADRSKTEEICKVVIMDSESVMQVDRLSPIPEQTADIEEMITNYHIKNNKPHALLSEQIEVEVPPASREETIELDGGGDVPPVFIEISVDKDTNPANSSSEDCLMVLESVQVELDPATLMLPERDSDEELELEQGQTEHGAVKKDDPISLLTSSDEDDVIIQEPHIDTVEVSDETDEDDMPLVKLLKKKPVKRKLSKKKSKKVSVNPEAIQKLIWSGVYGFYCIQCQYKTMDSMEYALHLKDHHKVLQVCHICNYTSASKTQFSRHVRKHKEEKKFKCHICDYRARHQMSLMYHIECHYKEKNSVKSGKKELKCNNCPFRGDTKESLVKHKKNCNGGAKFSCDFCFYTSKRKSDLRRHVASRHKGEKVQTDSDSSYSTTWA